MRYKGIKFVYGEPALIINAEKKDYLLVGDLHIGVERKLSEKGVHISNAMDFMIHRLKKIMKEFALKDIIMLGDIKDTILYPDSADRRSIKRFFDELNLFNVRIVAGNHDAHLDEMLDIKIERELMLGNFGLLHGDKKPDERTMLSDYLITAHNHATMRIRDEKGAIYEEKIWVVSEINPRSATNLYENFNKKIRLVVLPAFNDLISGTAIGRESDNRNPLFKNGIFDYKSSRFYTLRGELVELKNRRAT